MDVSNSNHPNNTTNVRVVSLEASDADRLLRSNKITGETVAGTEIIIKPNPILEYDKTNDNVVISIDLSKYTNESNFENTMFKLIDDVPRLFELEKVVNEAQKVNETLDTNLMAESDIVKESTKLFSQETLTVRTKLRKSINGIDIGDPTSFSDNTLEYVIPERKIDFTRQTSNALARLKTAISIFKAFRYILYTIPESIKVQPNISNELWDSITKGKMFKNMYPNIFFSYFSNQSEWFRNELLDLFNHTNFQIGERDTEIYGAIKKSATVCTVTDQYAVELARLANQNFEKHQATKEEIIARYEANSFEDTKINIEEYQEPIKLCIYQPSSEDNMSFILHLMVSLTDRNEMISQYSRILKQLNSFESISIDNALSWNEITSNLSNIIPTYRSALNQAKTVHIEDMLLMETFSFNYDFKFKYINPSDKGMAFFVLIAAIFYSMAFPNIYRKAHGEIGYMVCMALSILLPRKWIDFVRKNGYIEDISGVKVNSTELRKLDVEQLHKGIRYTIMGKKGLTSHDQIMKELAHLLQVKEYEYTLNRKRAANLPYFRSDYKTKMSWKGLKYHEVINMPGLDEWQAKIAQIQTWSDSVLRAVNGSGTTTNKSLSLPIESLKDIINRQSTNLQDSNTLFNFDFARIQEFLKQSFGYVYDEFYDQELEYNTYPRSLVFANLLNDKVTNGVKIHTQIIESMDIFTPLLIALTTNGIVSRNLSRNLINPEEAKKYLDSPRQPSYIRSDDLDNYYLKQINKSRDFNIASWILTCLKDPKQVDDNPWIHIRSDIATVMNFKNYRELMNVVYKSFDLDWNLFFRNVDTGLAYDTRMLEYSLYRADRNLLSMDPIRENLNDVEIFGKKMTQIEAEYAESFNVINKILDPTIKVSNEETIMPTKILPICEGLLLGKMFVNEIEPSRSQIESQVDIWKKDFRIATKFEFKYAPYGEHALGNSPILEVTSHYDSGDIVIKYDLPYHGKEDIPIIHVKYFSDLPDEFLKYIAIAINEGQLIVIASKQRICARTIIDQPTKGIYYESSMNPSKILDILRTPRYDIVEYDFLTTKYATNYMGNSHLIKFYKQYVFPRYNLDANIHAAILGYDMKDSASVLPDKYELTFGEISNDGRMSVTIKNKQVYKVDLPVVNWNNGYKAYKRDLLKDKINIIYTPVRAIYDL